MKHLAIASALLFGVAQAAIAAEPPKNAEATPAGKAAMGVKLDTSQCDALWMKADSAKTGKLSATLADTYISDMKSVNADGDTTVEHPEFMKACEGGMIKKEAAASVGAPATTGSTNKVAPPSETSDRTPDKKSPTPPEQMDSGGGKTSDRTPEK